MSLPAYYTRLRPFAETFRRGRPILMYHHVGPRRRGARLKGLYVSPRLFARQMVELASAGFGTPAYDAAAAPAAPASAQVWVTFDDGFRDVFEHALPVLRARRLVGIQFLVSELLGKTNEWQQRAGDIVEPLMDEAQVRDWLGAGQEIGAHTQSHPRLTQIPLTQAREEIRASKKSLEDRFGIPIRHFCYPYGDWNEAVRDEVIAAGYRSACTTMRGINDDGTSPFELKRFTARYPSRNLKAIWARLRGL
jgi:peptidoglycan/xylan/chitin deacetylase (PgdA/CDA1 family)